MCLGFIEWQLDGTNTNIEVGVWVEFGCFTPSWNLPIVYFYPNRRVPATQWTWLLMSADEASSRNCQTGSQQWEDFPKTSWRPLQDPCCCLGEVLRRSTNLPATTCMAILFLVLTIKYVIGCCQIQMYTFWFLKKSIVVLCNIWRIWRLYLWRLLTQWAHVLL